MLLVYAYIHMGKLGRTGGVERGRKIKNYRKSKKLKNFERKIC